MITDNNKIDTFEEHILSCKTRLKNIWVSVTASLSSLGIIIPDMVKEAMPYATDVKDFNKYFYMTLIMLNIGVTVYVTYKNNKLNKKVADNANNVT